MPKRFEWDAANRRDALRTRPVPSPVTAWWLTNSRYPARCGHCGNDIAARTAAAYNHAERVWLCACCTETLGISPQPSRRLVAAEEDKTRKTKAATAKRAKRRGKAVPSPARGSSGPPAALLSEAWRRGPGWCVARHPGKAWKLVRTEQAA